jgi:ribosomal protein S18 acetylase RimI-like enzyme
VTSEVRLLGPEDVDAFRRVRLEALTEEPAPFASAAADGERLSDAEWLERRRGGPLAAGFAGGEPVGLMGLLRQPASRMAHRATLIMVYVRASHRGTGLADALLDTMLAAARTGGIRQVELAASAENPRALAFYRRRGFSEVGRIPGGFLHEGSEIDEVLLALRL